MYRKILIPLDGSIRAERILKHVENIALQNNAKVIFLQVIKPVLLTDGYMSLAIEESNKEYQDKFDESLQYLNSVAGEFREKGLQTSRFVETGSIVGTILAVAARENVDLIAMASHGRGGLSRVFYGSVAAGVLQGVDRPLLLIRSRFTD